MVLIYNMVLKGDIILKVSENQKCLMLFYALGLLVKKICKIPITFHFLEITYSIHGSLHQVFFLYNSLAYSYFILIHMCRNLEVTKFNFGDKYYCLSLGRFSPQYSLLNRLR